MVRADDFSTEMKCRRQPRRGPGGRGEPYPASPPTKMQLFGGFFLAPGAQIQKSRFQPVEGVGRAAREGVCQPQRPPPSPWSSSSLSEKVNDFN